MNRVQNGHSMPGMSLVEILLVVAIAGVIAIFTIPMIKNSPSRNYPFVMDDYVQHLATVYNKIQLETGNSPINAELVPDPDPNAANPKYADGIETALKDWETIATLTAGPPEYLSYPNKIRVYLDPEVTTIPDPANLLPIHQAGSPATIMAGTDNKEWLLLDVNGSDGGNRIDLTDGDRVLLIVDDATGRVLTAWQKCKELGGTVAGNNCTMSAVAPTRVYYKSIYDQLKGY